ncbi:TolB family protein [Streptomyces sp. NPDC004752]
MTRPVRLIQAGTSAAVTLLMLSACSTGPKPPDIAAPKVTGTVFVAGTAKDGSAMVWKVTHGSARTLLSDTAANLPATSVSLSPDGRHLAYVSRGIMYVKDLGSRQAHAAHSAGGIGEERATDPGMPDDSRCSTWSPDGSHVAFTVERGVFVYDASGTGRMVSGRPVSEWREGHRDLDNLASAPTYHDAAAASDITCAQWIDNKRLAFDGLGEDSAESIGAAEADTTIVARIDTKKPELTRLLARWTAGGACRNRVLLDFHPEQSISVTPSPVANSGRGPGRPLLVNAGALSYRTYADNPQTAGKDLTATRLSDRGAFWAFTPGTCQLVGAAPTSPDPGTYDYLVTTIDAKTGATVKRRSMPLAVGKGGPLSRPTGGQVTRNPHAGANTVSYVTGDGKVGIIDLATGGATELKGPWKTATATVAWRDE